MNYSDTYETRAFGPRGLAGLPDIDGVARSVYRAIASAADKCTGFVGGTKTSIIRGFKIRQTYESLANLDDFTLKDIGLNRCELRAVAIHSVENPDNAYPRQAW